MDEAKMIEMLLEHGIRPTANRLTLVKTLALAGRALTMTELEDLQGAALGARHGGWRRCREV